MTRALPDSSIPFAPCGRLFIVAAESGPNQSADSPKGLPHIIPNAGWQFHVTGLRPTPAARARRRIPSGSQIRVVNHLFEWA